MQVYDHNIKAGNQGDLIKHPSLIAALNSLSEQLSERNFRYTDLFAGYGVNPIIAGNEWSLGIGLIHPMPATVNNPDLQQFRDRYLSRPELTDGIYPGSALIASEVLRHNNLRPELTLYDISESALTSLRQTFPEHRVIPRPALPDDEEIANSDFLFIDPPGLYSEKNPAFPSLSYLLQFEKRMKDPKVMFWLPITGDGEVGGETELSRESARQLTATGYQVFKVRWADHHRTVGCIIATKLPEQPTKRVAQVIKAITENTGWGE